MLDLQRPITRFILKGNIFISLCAVGLCLETAVILNAAFQSLSFYIFIFCSTLFTYNLYYFKSTEFNHHKILAFTGFIGTAVSWYYTTKMQYFYLGIICALSSVYLFPIFYSFTKPNLFTIKKLFILIIVWVLITFLFPVPNIHFNYQNILLLGYRILLMSHLCLLFFIKDELNPFYKKTAKLSCYVITFIQLILCILIALAGSGRLALVYFFVTLLTAIISHRFNSTAKSNLHYLLFVDGIMLLQSIFVLLKFIIAK